LQDNSTETISRAQLKNIESQIKKLYREKNYHHVSIKSELREGDDTTYVAHFDIKEGVQSRVKIVNFKGNNGFRNG